MQQLSNEDYKLYKSVIKISQKGLKKTLGRFLRKNYDTVINNKEYIYAKGDIPIALVAHLDTVWKKFPEMVCYDREQGIIWSPDGGCGDDRAGVFAILKILRSGLKPTVIFTTDEEIGGVGATALVRDFPRPLTELSYIIQLDRRGVSDCVFYDCNNNKFTEYIESFGFIEALGSFSDISTICPAWGIAGVNLSIGYEDEHSISEIVRVPALLQIIKKVKKMLTQREIPSFNFIPSKYYINYNAMYPIEDYSWAMGYDEDYSSGNAVICAGCGELVYPYNAIPINGEHYCISCFEEGKIDFCSWCGTPFIKTAPDRHLCDICQIHLEEVE